MMHYINLRFTYLLMAAF